jgi:hypothetical protein
MVRQDTSLEAEGAEFLVCGHLMIEGIVAYKAYSGTAGYDVLAIDPASGRSVRIQVKSRWASDARHQFPIKNTDCDFVVYVRLNRGSKRKSAAPEKSDPEYFVLPVASVLSVRRADDWGVAQVGRIAELENYRSAWNLIREHLSPDEPDKTPDQSGYPISISPSAQSSGKP